jgi:hypothetical protein
LFALGRDHSTYGEDHTNVSDGPSMNRRASCSEPFTCSNN